MIAPRFLPMALVLMVGPAWIRPAVGSQAASGPSATPCSAPEHRQFDFWMGEWDVTDATGHAAGSSAVAKALGGCAIREDFQGLGQGKGFVGQSLSTYQPSLGAWRQTWIDSTGKHTDLYGTSGGEGRMSLNGETVRGGRRILTRLSWDASGPDKVRQAFHVSSDGGVTWTVAFELTYTRRRTS